MRLLRLSDNAHMLETSSGALLFSYEVLVAARVRSVMLRSPSAPMSVATRAHMMRFTHGERLPSPAQDVREFAMLCRRVLSSLA